VGTILGTTWASSAVVEFEPWHLLKTFSHRGSGEVQVVLQTRLPRPLEQAEQSSPFSGTCPPPNDHDDAKMRLMTGQFKKIVAIAGDQNATVVASELEDSGIGGVRRKNLTKQQDLVAEFLEQITQVIRDIVVQYELQGWASAICRATSRSISPL